MSTRDEKTTTSATALAKARFVKVSGATKELDQDPIDPGRPQTVRPLRTVTVDVDVDIDVNVDVHVDGHLITATPQLNQDAEQILAKLPPVTG